MLLRWALQKGFAVIPKSVSSKTRQQANLALTDFELTAAEMESLSGMQSVLGVKGSRWYWNPVEDADVQLKGGSAQDDSDDEVASDEQEDPDVDAASDEEQDEQDEDDM